MPPFGTIPELSKKSANKIYSAFFQCALRPGSAHFFDALWKKDKKGGKKTFSEHFTPPKTANQGPKQPRLHQKCRNSDRHFSDIFEGL